MQHLLSCSRGHTWQADPARRDDSTCPECGLPWIKPNGSTSDAGSEMPTDLQSQLTAVAALVQAPPEIPDFDILEEVGRGGMGIVYRARYQPDGKIVAVKVIRKDRLQHDESVRRFRREAQAAARLSHPNIVQVCDYDHTGDTHYLAMEYVDGITLERQVECSGPLTIPQACDFVRQAALGLQHAHEQALVHRDIKPSNLMVTTVSGAPQVKLLDMGVARVLQLAGQSLADSLSTLTQGGAVIGTADFVAPEQLEDPHGADIRADLYSLGCTFYYLLTAQVPFPGGSLISKLDKQRWQAPTSLDHLRGDIPPAVVRVVEKLMAKKPAERFQNPGELADALALLAKHDYADAPMARLEFKEQRRLIGHLDAIWSVRFSPTGKQLASAGKDGLVILWDAATGQIVQRFAKHPSEVRSVAFAPTGDQLASASGFTARLFDVRGQEIRRFSGHSAAIRCLAFAHDGKRLATGSDDKTIRICEVSTGREVQRFSWHTAGITALAYVPNANQLASASRDQTVRVWDLKSGLEVEALDAQAGNVLDIALSPDGKRLASSHFDTAIRIWDLSGARLERKCTGHKQMVSALAFTLDGKQLVSASQDHTARLWDADDGTELACSTPHTAGVNALALAPDGTRLATAGADKLLIISTLPTE